MATVWEILSDHNTLPQWRVDCRAVSILSTHHVGQGVRRRISPQRGKDFLEDFKAWYNGFGYEYQIMDSKSYKYNLSRLRLQATPEGTIVQWTIEYDIKGFWAQLLGGRRRRYLLEKTVIDSLRELRRYVVAKGIPIDDVYRTKAGVQDAPDVEKRAAYGAQLFSQIEATEQVEDATGPNKPVTLAAEQPAAIPEPPVRPDDTPSIPLAPPPSFITSQFDVKTPAVDEFAEEAESVSAPKVSDTQPSAPITLMPEVKADTLTVETSAPSSTPVTMQPPSFEPTPPPSVEEVQIEVAASVSSVETKTSPVNQTVAQPVVKEAEKSTPSTPAVMSAPDTSEEKLITVIDKRFMEDTRAKTKPKPPEGLAEALAKDEPPKRHRDTDQMSIWDVFGVARPAELDTSVTSPSADDSPAEITPAPVQMSAPPTTTPAKIEVADTPELFTPIEPTKTAKKKNSLSIDEILALEEPPLPASASASVNTIVRQSTQSMNTVGLRKQQRRKMTPVRSNTLRRKVDKGG